MFVSLFRLFGLTGSRLAAAALVMSGAVALGQEDVPGLEERDIIIRQVLLDDSDDKGKEDQSKKDNESDNDDQARPAYWIGIALEGQEGEQGLTVRDVLPDSPALKAGLQAGDLIAAVGEKKLERLEQLIDLIQDSGGKSLELHVVREGKEVTVHVKPGQRPTESPQPSETPKAPDSSRYTPAPTPPPAASPPIRFRDPQRPDASPSASDRAGSSSAVPPGGGSSARPRTARITMAFPSSQLPDDMQVTITKKGNRPAVIVARQGEKLWKTTENGLDMLPPAAQAYAARSLGKDIIRAQMPGGGPPGMGGMMMPGMGGGMMMQPPPGAPAMGMGGMAPSRREVRAIELRTGKDGRVEAVQDGKPAPYVKVLPGGGIQLEVREGEETKNEGKVEKTGEKEHPARAERIRDLQREAERLRDQLNKLREEQKERENK